MEDFDIIILTTILSTLFLVFGITVYNEFKKMSRDQRNYQNSQLERGPRADLLNFIGSLVDNDTTNKLTTAEKEAVFQSVKRTISDMESDGVYFPKEVKVELERKRKELTCEYSGLASVMSYSENDQTK